MEQSSDIVEPRLLNILPNMLLSTTYACHQGSFRPVDKLSTATLSFKSIKFDVASWNVFKNYFDLINTYFQDAYRFQDEEDEDEVNIASAALAESGFATCGNDATPVAGKYEPPRAKKQNTSRIQFAICMQKVTFDELKIVLPCVDERLKKL
ncbi:hypothetical protein TSAR_012077 [Trichomalopsis sarcophagae]|uniref:Uncharacterized protein n=1 Tax=Trichomalopsis sarcophagae TaxID=543379 RepID=A0A232EUI0_9HYME|nr:hypothetical protein TSAR_012077 [Trichomalopsis sarcophagae]